MTRRARVAACAVGVIGLGLLEWYAFVAGDRLNKRHPGVKLGAGPFVGSWDLRLSVMIVPAVLLAVLVVAFLPLLVERLSVRWAIVTTASVAAVFVLALAA